MAPLRLMALLGLVLTCTALRPSAPSAAIQQHRRAALRQLLLVSTAVAAPAAALAADADPPRQITPNALKEYASTVDAEAAAKAAAAARMREKIEASKQNYRGSSDLFVQRVTGPGGAFQGKDGGNDKSAPSSGGGGAVEDL